MVVYAEYAKERGEFLYGLTVAQVVIVVGGLGPVLVCLAAQRWVWLGCSMLGWGLLVVVTVVPARGRSVTQWVGAWVGFRVGSVLGWTRWQSRAAAGRPGPVEDFDLPGVLSGLRLHDGPPMGAAMRRTALLENRSDRTWTVVAKIAHPGIGLRTAAERDRLGGGLASLLDVAARGEIVSMIAVTVRSIPDDGAERARWLATHTAPDAPGLSRAVTATLEQHVGRACVRSECFVSVVAPDAAIARPARDAGGGLVGRARVLYSVLGEIESQLLGPAGASEVRWLTGPELGAAIRTGFAPGDRAGLVEAEADPTPSATLHPAAAGSAIVAAPGVTPATAGPSGAVTAARGYVHDAWTSASVTLVLPSEGAVMGALAPVLVPARAGERRCLSVFYPVTGGAKALGAVVRRENVTSLAAGMRARLQVQASTKTRVEAARSRGMDAKLVGGRSLVRPSAVATVTVPSSWSIDDGRRRLEASARGAGFVSQSLDLAQDSGFVAGVIPAGIGLRPGRSLR